VFEQLSDIGVYEPQTRARLETTANVCEAVVRKGLLKTNIIAMLYGPRTAARTEPPTPASAQKNGVY